MVIYIGYGTYETTHQNIIDSGKRLFMANGYERTNMRELCKAAGITPGSYYRHFASKEELFSFLVQPAVDGLYQMYHEAEELCFDNISTEHLKKLWKIGDETVVSLVRFIYQNFDSFKLLLQCSDGTPYSFFVNDIVKMEVESSIKMLTVMHERGVVVHDLSKKEFHMLSHAYLASIFECVIHDYSEDETLSYTHTLVEFFNAGWQKVLGFSGDE